MEKRLKGENLYVSYCGRYYCVLCSYHRGTIVDAAKSLLTYVERVGSLRIMANAYRICDFDEFVKGLTWLASQSEPCKGCRFGGGWSWWRDCPSRTCCIQKDIDFCYQCDDFPCESLQKGHLLEARKMIIEANNQIKSVGIKNWLLTLKKKYKQ